MKIPFNKTYNCGNELPYISEALSYGELSGNYHFSRKVKELMLHKYSLEAVFLTPSCTAALEMGAMLADIQPGDEVIMPSFTFTSTANAVMIFGAKPVFCEVREADMNIDVSKIEDLITDKTKMIIPIDYGGVPCDIDPIMELAEKYRLIVLHDCAQSYGSKYKDELTGKRAHLACYSFHDTKNITCGEGGALVVNRPEWRERAGFLMEKGTDRTKMLRGLQDKYTWIEKGSSYLLSDILAAMLLAQLEKEDEIFLKRKMIYEYYFKAFWELEKSGLIQLQNTDPDKQSNYHTFWIIFKHNWQRDFFIDKMQEKEVAAYSSYIPLHSSKMGRQLGYLPEDLPLTEELAESLVRLPIYPDLKKKEYHYVAETAIKIILENFT